MIYINRDLGYPIQKLVSLRINGQNEFQSTYNHAFTNTQKSIRTTCTVGNFDRKKKDLDSPDTLPRYSPNSTSSILIQICSDDQQFSQSVHDEMKYGFQ